jgi:hypothetical protein
VTVEVRFVDEAITELAVAHERRRPLYWSDRKGS